MGDPESSGMNNRMRVVLDLELRSYRETIGLALRHLRPHHEFAGPCPPGTPRFVISDRPDPNGTFAWAEVRYAEHEVTRFRVGEERGEVKGLDLPGLLDILDLAERAAGLPRAREAAERAAG